MTSFARAKSTPKKTRESRKEKRRRRRKFRRLRAALKKLRDDESEAFEKACLGIKTAIYALPASNTENTFACDGFSLKK